MILSLALLVYSDAQSQHPNIIYIMTDDMGYGDLSGYGRKDYTTPNIDKLASQGMKFVNAYSAAPLCTPARAAFMTGRYPARTPVGLIEPITGNKKDTAFGLTAEYPSIATLMRDAGYETAAAKAHKDFPLDGIDLISVLAGKKKNIDRIFYWRTFQRIRQKAVRDGNWKYLQDEKGEWLFNLDADPGEKNDLKAKEEIIFTRLKKEFADWEKTVLQSIPL